MVVLPTPRTPRERSSPKPATVACNSPDPTGATHRAVTPPRRYRAGLSAAPRSSATTGTKPSARAMSAPRLTVPAPALSPMFALPFAVPKDPTPARAASPSATALSSNRVPASAPGPSAPVPPPRVSVARPIRWRSSAVQLIQPPNGSVRGTPSSSTSVRELALPPSPLSVSPWLVGEAERLSERRNCCTPPSRRTVFSTDGAAARSTSSSTTLANAASPAGDGRSRPVMTTIGMMGGSAGGSAGGPMSWSRRGRERGMAAVLSAPATPRDAGDGGPVPIALATVPSGCGPVPPRDERACVTGAGA